MTNGLLFDHPWCNAKHCWRSVDTHFQDVAGSVSLSCFPQMAANTLIMYSNNRITFELPDLEVPNSLTLCWHSLSKWGRGCVALCFAHKASQCHTYEWLQPIAMQIMNDARSDIVDTLWTLRLAWVYPQYVITEFGIVYYQLWSGSLCTVFM